MKKKSPVYAALDLHSGMSVLGSMEHGGKTGARMRFATEAETLRAALTRLRSGKKHSRKWSEWEKAFGKWVSSSGSQEWVP